MDSMMMLDALQMVSRAFVRETDGEFREVVEAYLESPLEGLPDSAQKRADRGLAKLRQTLGKRKEATDKELWDDYLDASYADLFLGVAAGSSVPQESVYCSPERVTHQKPFFEVCDIMVENGYAKPQGCLEPEDHIGLEWTFFTMLMGRAIVQNDAEAREAAMAFKANHMDNWMSRSFEDIINQDDMGYYTGMAYIAQALLECADSGDVA